MNGKEFNSIPIYLTSLAIIKKLFLSGFRASNSPVVGIRTQNFKYFRNFQDPKKDVHLYDLKNDPLEDNNIADKRSDIVKEMELNVEKIQEDSLPLLNEEEEIDDEEIIRVQESLKKLGYI